MGCPIGNDKYPKPADLNPAWKLDRLRVLAIQAEPPEIRPGEAAAFSGLIIDPQEESGAVVWLACPPDEEGAGGAGCAIDPNFDFTSATPDELADAGFIGFEPFLPPRFEAPDDSLDSLDEEDRAEGLQILVQTAVLPSDTLDDGFSETAFDFNDVEVAYKRLIVSEALTPNENPALGGFVLDGIAVLADAEVLVEPSQQYEVGAWLADGSIQTYIYVNPDGIEEERVEQPYIKWYTDGGTMLEDATLYPFLDATWEVPSTDAEITSGTWWAVVRDRRGGLGWASQRWRLRDPVP
jgi:hypothetical protein